MGFDIKPFAFGQLASGITSAATQLTLRSGQAARFPTYAVVTVWNTTLRTAAQAYLQSEAEVMVLKFNSGDTFDIVSRALHGTTARDLNTAAANRYQVSLGTPQILGANYWNALSFGLDPTGTADIQVKMASLIAAVAAAGGGTIFLPEGTYLRSTDTAWTISADGVTVLGEGPKTVIRATSGTADFFSVTGDKCAFRGFRMEGPNNTGVDGIVYDGCSGFHVEDVEGYQLSTTVTVGSTTECTDGRLLRVHSDDNTQQGVHINKAQRVEVSGPTAVGIGTAVGHHGLYVGNCRDVVVTDPVARDCTGSGVHVFAQSSYAGRGVIVKGARCAGNGTAGSGNRAGILVSADSTSTLEDVIVEACYCFDNGGFNYLIGGITDIDVLNCVANGNAKATTHGFYAESVAAGNRSYRFRGCRSKDHANGFRLAFTSGTIDECILEGNVIDGNTTGVNASGASLANTFVRPDNRFRGNGTDITGTVDQSWLVPGSIGVGNSAAATTPGSVTDKIEVFDETGASLGFLPVYDAIT